MIYLNLSGFSISLHLTYYMLCYMVLTPGTTDQWISSQNTMTKDPLV